MPSAITVFKFVGTISLGLLTGVSYTLSTLSLPALLTLPAAKPAQHTFTTLVRTARRHALVLTGISVSTFALAFALSPRRARHPYLLWTAIVAALGQVGAGRFQGQGQALEAKLEDEDVNGEMVERAVRQTQASEAIRAGLSGLAFAMGVVGLWGDGV